MTKSILAGILLICAASCNPVQEKAVAISDTTNADMLPSWNEGETKKSIVDFVAYTTTEKGPGFIPEADRIACFDNDGTLWGEQPAYFQFLYAIDRVKALAPQHPEWNKKEPFSSIIKGDVKGLLASGEKGLASVIMATHANMTADDFDKAVKDWITTAVHPKTGKPYYQMTYQPMIELLQFLRSHGYKTFIVSGGGVDFLRSWTEQVYGIPPYQVVGSSIKAKYEVKNGQPQIVKIPELNFIDDKEGKPIGIYQHIGKRPVFTAGNSDGDYAMLEWTTTASGYPRFGMIIHHTDSTRESAYDRESHIGRLSKGLDSARAYKWTVVDMKKDWKKVFSFD
jgi:phosphoglycolate phosphatase-like HAD superfamily hydrolase